MEERTEVNVIDFKLIDAYTTLCLSKEKENNTIEELLLEVKVPEKYKNEVSIKVAKKRVEVLEDDNGKEDDNDNLGSIVFPNEIIASGLLRKIE